MEEEQQQMENADNGQEMATKSVASFVSAQITIFYLFWIMFLGEVIRWDLGDGKLYRPIRDSYLIPFADIFIVGHHWVGKILTGTILILVIYFLAKKIKRYKGISEEKMIRNGYALITAFWIYAAATLVYFFGHLYHFWFF